MMLLELDYTSPPRSPLLTTHTHTHSHSLTHQPSLTLTPPTHTHTQITHPHTPPLELPEKHLDIDPAELRKLYFAAMMNLKAEKQQRIHFVNVIVFISMIFLRRRF